MSALGMLTDEASTKGVCILWWMLTSLVYY